MNCNTAELIEKHEKAIKVLGAINHFERTITTIENSKRMFPGFYHAEQLEKWERNIEIDKMCIDRLKQRYNKILNN